TVSWGGDTTTTGGRGGAMTTVGGAGTGTLIPIRTPSAAAGLVVMRARARLAASARTWRMGEDLLASRSSYRSSASSNAYRLPTPAKRLRSSFTGSWRAEARQTRVVQGTSGRHGGPILPSRHDPPAGGAGKPRSGEAGEVVDVDLPPALVGLGL